MKALKIYLSCGGFGLCIFSIGKHPSCEIEVKPETCIAVMIAGSKRLVKPLGFFSFDPFSLYSNLTFITARNEVGAR